jgi:hypothetical protein
MPLPAPAYYRGPMRCLPPGSDVVEACSITFSLIVLRDSAQHDVAGTSPHPRAQCFDRRDRRRRAGPGARDEQLYKSDRGLSMRDSFGGPTIRSPAPDCSRRRPATASMSTFRGSRRTLAAPLSRPLHPSVTLENLVAQSDAVGIRITGGSAYGSALAVHDSSQTAF